MKSAIWILVSFLFSGHTIAGYSLQYDGGHESGGHVPQTRTTRYVDTASGRWNANIGYTNTRETEGGVLGGLLETVRSSTSGKDPGSDQVNAKGSFQIKVDADAANARPTDFLGSVISKAASVAGSLSDLAKKNIESRRNFRESIALEGNSYLGANGHNFADQDHVIGASGHDAATSTKVVTVASQSQITSNSEAVNGFKTEGRRKDSRFTEEQFSGGIRNGQNEKSISEQNLGLQKEIIITSLPSITKSTTSTFGGSRIASSNFGGQFSGRKAGSYSSHTDDSVGTGSHIRIAGTPATQFSRSLEYENESSSGHGSVNVGYSGFPPSIKEDVAVTIHAQEGAANIQNLKTASQTSSFKSYTSNNGNLHDNSHGDYKDSDESIEIEDYATSQKEVAGKSGHQVLANGQFDIKTAEVNSGLRSQYSGIGHTTDNDSSSESEEDETEHLTENSGLGRFGQNIPHPTLLNYRPDSDYIDSDESEKIEDNGSEITETLIVNSQEKETRPTIAFQKGITGDYQRNLREHGSSGYGKLYTESSASNSESVLHSSSADLINQENLSGTKLVQTEVSTTTHFNDNAEDLSVYRTGYPSHLFQESSSKKIDSNVRSNERNRSDDSSDIGRHSLAVVEAGTSSVSLGRHSDNSELVEKDKYDYTSGITRSQEDIQQEKSLGGTFTSNTGEFAKPSKSENKHETSVTITSLNQQNGGRESDFAITDGRSETSQFHVGQVARRGYNQNYDENEESTNRRVFEENRQAVSNSEGQSRTLFPLEPEERRRLITSPGDQHFESNGEVEDTVLDNSERGSLSEVHQFKSNVYPIIDDRGQNSRAFSIYGPRAEYFHVHPGTKIVRKEITETVHTGGGPPHEFDHRQILKRPLRRDFNEGDFGSISQPEFLSTDRQLHELHHGHDHDRFERRFLNRQSQQGFLGSFDSPHNVKGDVGFGPQAHILGEIHSHGGGREFDQFHSVPISYSGEGHEGGRVGFRKIVKVTHEIEDVPRHGREVHFGHGHYYH